MIVNVNKRLTKTQETINNDLYNDCLSYHICTTIADLRLHQRIKVEKEMNTIFCHLNVRKHSFS